MADNRVCPACGVIIADSQLVCQQCLLYMTGPEWKELCLKILRKGDGPE